MPTRLYREMLRSLRGVDADTKAGLRVQIRQQFEAVSGERDPSRIQTLLADGRDSLRQLQMFLQANATHEHEHVHGPDCGHDAHDSSAPAHDHGHVHGPGCGHEELHEGYDGGHDHSHGGDPLPPELLEARRRALGIK